MERRRVSSSRKMLSVRVLVLAALGVSLVAGCQTEKRKNNPYMSELGVKGTITDTPLEVQEFVKSSYPDSEVESVYEKRHKENYTMRHFEIHLVHPGNRRQVIEYNVFQKPTKNAYELQKYEATGIGSAPAAQKTMINP